MAHAKNRPPSVAHRWLSCYGSPAIVQTYPNNSTDASKRGDISHELLENAITWGVVPNHPDVDLVYSAMFTLDKVTERINELGGPSKVKVFGEQELDIPETGEFGTTDVILLSDTHMEIIDHKNGYVPVNIYLNPQLLLYLCGAIAKYGERKHYRISVSQPNYVHADGMFRSMDINQEQLDWFRNEVAVALLNDHLVAGKHCKTSYCPHRGSCEVFLAWSVENMRLAWFPGEVAGMSDEQLAEALEQSEVMQGARDMYRGEALRRILHQDRKIPGYKVVKAKRDRDYADDAAREATFSSLKALGAAEEDLFERKPISIAGVERIVKRIFKPHGRGAWMKGMDEVLPPERLQPTNQSLTLEKAIDGRQAHKRGSEFGALKATPADDTSELKDIL